jgi:hypothetical protein
MATAAAPVPVYVPVAEAMVIMAHDQEGNPGDWNIPFTRAHWRTVVALIREGDEIVIVAEEGGLPVIEIPAVVIALDGATSRIQVIA